jgi:hypothetical protein
MDIGEVLVTSWKITWKNKILWLFGLLIAFSQAVNLANNAFNIATQTDILPSSEMQNFGSYMDIRSPVFWVGLISIACGLMVFLLFLSSIGQIGIIKGVALADSSENATPSRDELAKAIKHYFGRIFSFSLIQGFTFLALFLFVYAVIVALIMGGLVASRETLAAGPVVLLATICFIPFICVFTVLASIMGAIITYAIVSMVNDDLGIWSGLINSIHFIKKNFWRVFLLIIVNAALGGVIGFALALPISFTSFIPLMALTAPEIGTSAGWVGILCLLAYAPVFVFLQAIFFVYVHSVWTLSYRRLSMPPLIPIEPILG